MRSAQSQVGCDKVMDNKGFGIIDGVLTLTIGIVVTTFIVFAAGMALDSFIFEFQSLEFVLTDTFSEAMEGVNVLGEMFYMIPIFMLFILTVWFFAGIVRRHTYTRYDEEEEEW